MKVFVIPCLVRFTHVGPHISEFFAQKTPMAVDNYGILVYHRNDHVPTEQEVRGTIIGLKDKKVFVPGNTLEEAMNWLYTYFPLTGIGGDGSGQKAMYPDPDKSPLELPDCPLMHTNDSDSYVCGEQMPGSPNGEFGMCRIGGYDGPPSCPLEGIL